MQRMHLFTAGALLALVLAASATAEVVTFEDPVVEQAVRSGLGLEPDAPLTPELVGTLEYVLLPDVRVQSLGGLEYARNLRWVHLGETDIATLAPLGGLPLLHEIIMESSDVTDLSPLVSLPTFTDLLLGRAPVEAMPDCSGSMLQRLGIDGSSIANLDGLRGSRVEAFAVTNAGVSDLSFVRDMPALTGLSLEGNEVCDLSPLAGMSQLDALVLAGNQIVDVSALAGLNRLDFLDLRDNLVVDLSPLLSLESLSHLDLRGNPLGEASLTVYLPAIVANNPGAIVLHDPIPEPATVALLVAGALGLWRRKDK